MTEVASHDGHRWIRLATREEINAENQDMALDVGHDGWNVNFLDEEPSNDGIWSLRDADGKRVLTVQITQSWDESWDGEEEWAFVDGIDIDSVQGPAGRDPNSREILHLSTLRTWFAGEGRTLDTTDFWSEEQFVYEEWRRLRGTAFRFQTFASTNERGDRKVRHQEEPQPARFIETRREFPDVSRLSDGSVVLLQPEGIMAFELAYLSNGAWKKIEFPDHDIEIGVENTLIQISGGKVSIRKGNGRHRPVHHDIFGQPHGYVFTGYEFPNTVIRRPPLPQPDTQWKLLL